ncbi:MAG: diguanylate cyclase [Anaerolineales bacterium]|nr:diguanylate cyclase [Anaerolineales bacterium]
MENKRVSKQIQELEEELSQANSAQNKIDALNNLAWKLRISQCARAADLSQEAIRLSKTDEYTKQHYHRGLAKGLITLAFLDSEAGKLDMAASQCIEALSYIEDQYSSEAYIDGFFTLGWIFYYLGDIPSALDYGLQALKLSQELNLRDREAWALDAVASFYRDPEQSVQMHAKALKIFEDIQDVEGQSRVLNNWACVLLEKGDPPAALKKSEKCLQLIQKHSMKKNEIFVSGTMAEILIAMGEYSQAQEILQEAISLGETYGPDISHAYLLVAMGQTFLAQNELEQAETYFLEALAVATNLEIRSERMHCHEYLSEVYERRGNFDQALEHYKIFHALKESVAGESSARQIATLKMSHQIETVKRDAEIQRLQNEKLKLEIEEHKRIQAILENLATRDSLTNLNNRRHFLILAEKEWHRALRYKHPFTVLMLDLDHFKQINDRYGHSIGDQALISVAGIIQATLRASEIAGRYGGDEFAIILPETTAQNGLLVSRRICNEIIEQVIQTETGPIALTASIGVAGLSDENRKSIQNLDALLIRADKALYKAKRAGKNQTYLYPDEE